MLCVLVLSLGTGVRPAEAAGPETLRVGSKRFTESYVLGEVLRETAARSGARAEHRPGLGNTAITFAALRSGAIDVYVEYTGTIARDVLKLDRDASLDELDRLLAPMGLGVAAPLGFENTYALAMREDRAAALGIRSISDLAGHPSLRLAFTQEFIGQPIGWEALRATYRLPQAAPRGLDHAIGYQALADGRIDVKEIYTTDARIRDERLRVLVDDRRFFPRYDAVLLYRRGLPNDAPRAWAALVSLAGRIDAATMITLNAAVERDGRSFADAARDWIARASPAVPVAAVAPAATDRQRTWYGELAGPDFLRLTRQHLVLVAVSVAAAVLAGVPLGLLAFRRPRLGRWVLGAAAVVQTVPSLALLALLIAAFGQIGALPALVALFLYALLPIVQNTHVGLAGVSTGQRQAAAALGLRPAGVLRHVELPLAAAAIVAGIRTSAVLNVGTATIAAFVGAGGYGERIVKGLALNDSSLLLAGALPSAALAILVQWGLGATERTAQRRRSTAAADRTAG